MAGTRRGLAGPAARALTLTLTLGAGAGEARAQSLLERSPNTGGTWVGRPGTLHFHFLHRFESSGPPERKVSNTPTFLLAASLPAQLLAGARYATNSTLVSGIPNEWELFARFNPVSQSRGGPLDLAVHAGFNDAGESLDGELSVARTFGALRVMALGRAFSDFARTDSSRVALGGGIAVRLTQHIALAGDLAGLLDAEEDEDAAWSVGLQLAIPFTPHTFSLHYSNTNTTTLQGASLGAADGRWGFEFTVPLTPSRYLGRGGGAADTVVAPPAGGQTGDVVEVTMTNQLSFEPRTLRIRAGQTVVWRNTSEVLHTVTADPAKAANRANVQLPEGAEPFDSGNLAPGDVFRHTFTTPGEYRYICIPHEIAGGMLGTVIVEG